MNTTLSITQHSAYNEDRHQHIDTWCGWISDYRYKKLRYIAKEIEMVGVDVKHQQVGNITGLLNTYGEDELAEEFLEEIAIFNSDVVDENIAFELDGFEPIDFGWSF